MLPKLMIAPNEWLPIFHHHMPSMITFYVTCNDSSFTAFYT